MIYRDLVSWVALFFDENNIVKIGIDHVVCEEIAATDG